MKLTTLLPALAATLTTTSATTPLPSANTPGPQTESTLYASVLAAASSSTSNTSNTSTLYTVGGSEYCLYNCWLRYYAICRDVRIPSPTHPTLHPRLHGLIKL